MAAAKTTLANIKVVAKDDTYIQGLSAGDPEVELILEDVARYVPESVYGEDTEMGQRYLAAHLLSASNQPVGGRGPLSSMSVGGVSRSWTLPYINQKSVLGSTQYGLMFFEIQKRNILAFRVIKPPEDNL